MDLFVSKPIQPKFGGSKMILTPVRSIRAKCLDCCANQPKEVRLCSITKCPLWHYRMGKRPKKPLDSSTLPKENEDSKT